VVKALYAADAGIMTQINMVRMGQIGAPGTFVLTDDPQPAGPAARAVQRCGHRVL